MSSLEQCLLGTMSPGTIFLGTMSLGTGLQHPHEQLFCVELEYPLKLPYGYIAYKGTSPLHEQLFCVELDYSLKLPYGHIAYKGTSPLHEKIMCTFKETIMCTLSKDSYNFSLE